MKKVLVISGGDIERAGVQIFLTQWIKMAPPNEFEFFWYCLGEIKDNLYAKKIKEMKVQLIIGKHRKESNMYRYLHLYSDLCNLIRHESFDIIHVNTGGIIVQAVSMHIATRYRLSVKIAHSHSCIDTSNMVTHLICIVLQQYLRRRATYCVACSVEAGIALFGKKILLSPKWKVIQNTIDTNKFAFNAQIRQEYRKRISADSCKVLGCVGTLDKHKNQMFLLYLVNELKQSDIQNIKLLFIGDGELRDALQKKAENLGISENVYFIGCSDCVEKWLHAIDVFLMPSRTEGLGIAALEAQAAGLPCVLSDRIPHEVKVTKNVEFVPIEDIEKWKTAVRKFIKIEYDRGKESELVKNTKIDISNTIQYIESLYY